MARISLLLSLAFSLALGSMFISVDSYEPPSPLFPKTVSELQTLPFAKITEIINYKEKFAPKTAKIKAMFTVCKGYVKYLESLYKFGKPIVDVSGIAKTKYALTTKAILSVEASISGKVDKKTSLKLKESCVGVIKGLRHIQNVISKISAKHNYKADASISLRESNKIGAVILYFRNSITDFMDLVNDFEEQKLKKVAQHARALEEGRELTEEKAGNNTNEKVNGSDQSKYEKYFQYFGSFVEGKQHGRELTEEQTGGKINNLYEKFAKYMPYLRGKDNGRKLREDQAGVNNGAQSSGEFKGLFKDFFNFNSGEKVQMDAAGKMKVSGEDEFRSMNRAHHKLFVSNEAL
ncbi:unnamed protein product [Eruca vesicaria subsp. sativa]|uniref:Uncharacterized protein n=1 Tax=Eruca vesicaria subsp. sativa TaxID=29727 RepID=A0ABC8M852_ERUVS|nr:unnamed protein product [Eruca vesicaria subsp. sativa]